MAPAPWDTVPNHETLFVLVTGGNRYGGIFHDTDAIPSNVELAAELDLALPSV